MKRIIFSVYICLFLASCGEWERRQTDYHYIINQSNKEIVHILYTDNAFVKQDSIVFQVPEKSDTTLEWELSAIVGFGDMFRVFGYTDSRVFNLTDTMSIYFEDLHDFLYGINTIPEFLNIQYLGRESVKGKKETNDITEYYWTVNDSLLNIMRKDYSMLERFTDYYK